MMMMMMIIIIIINEAVNVITHNNCLQKREIKSEILS